MANELISMLARKRAKKAAEYDEEGDPLPEDDLGKEPGTLTDVGHAKPSKASLDELKRMVSKRK